MPAMLDDPTSPLIHRTHPTPDFAPKPVTLRGSHTAATIVPFRSLADAPPSLVAFLCAQLAQEIESGDSYPMVSALPLSTFGPYWFGTFAAVMLAGEFMGGAEEVLRLVEPKWEEICLGSFYVKPNYPGRSSHVCNAGFLVTDVRRNAGVGKLLALAYLDWAPKMGFTYSVFNLVYETNVASCKIWDSLGFERIGRVKKCGQLKSYPGKKIDAIVYGYDFEEAAEKAKS